MLPGSPTIAFFVTKLPCHCYIPRRGVLTADFSIYNQLFGRIAIRFFVGTGNGCRAREGAGCPVLPRFLRREGCFGSCHLIKILALSLQKTERQGRGTRPG